MRVRGLGRGRRVLTQISNIKDVERVFRIGGSARE
jgi:hypothetical protein